MNCDFVVFDLETTGLSSRFDEIIQIAAARLGTGGVVTEEVFATFVRPEATIPSFITGLTGISNRDVAGAPPVGSELQTPNSEPQTSNSRSASVPAEPKTQKRKTQN